MAPYGILQSLLDEKLLSDTLKDVRRVLAKNGIFGLELVADLPAWDEYANRVTLRGERGPHGGPIKLIETVKQDRRNHITRFEQQFVEGRGAGRDTPEIQPRVSHAVGAANGRSAGTGRNGGLGPAGRLPGWSMGSAGRSLDNPRAAGVK